MDKKELTRSIKAKALALGFQQCGVSEAKFLEKEAGLLEQWLSKDMHGKMAYMANNFDKRVDPTKLVDGAKSVISLAFNYYTDLTQRDKKAPKISKYAYGRDYHKVLKKKLKELLQFIEEVHGNFSGRAFVDSGPVLEKAWAAKSGLGWEGKNANMISKDVGSFFFLSELIVDIPLEYDIPVADHCGTCTKCIDACPTEAIVAPYVVDGSKCISYFTIELKEAIQLMLLENLRDGHLVVIFVRMFAHGIKSRFCIQSLNSHQKKNCYQCHKKIGMRSQMKFSKHFLKVRPLSVQS